MSNAPLMPKATAVWLVDNTALTFDQVADFTKMHPARGSRHRRRATPPRAIKGMDPISTGQLTRDEIEKGEKDPNYRLKLGESKVALPPPPRRRARAIRRCRAATSGRARSCGWCATIPN
jgi:hypothetical protein